jgi:uncharacterized delta-60 repeat protein
MRNKILFLSVLLLTTFSFNAKAQPGTIDPIFNPTDKGFGLGDGSNEVVESIAIQGDGKLIIAGNFTTYNRTTRNRIARLNADGTLDDTFDPGTGANNGINSIAIQSDGKIIIAGTFSNYNGTARNRIARLNTDGTLDNAFNSGTGANTSIFSAAVQSDGKIIIGGDFTTYNGTAKNCITRLNTDGTLDTIFNSGTGANEWIKSIAVQSDGKIIIGGNFDTYNGIEINRIARLNADGTLDTTFNPGTGVNAWLFSTSVQPDGKIIIGGDFTTYNGTSINRIARLNTDGTLDGSFNPGSGANNRINSTTIQNDGKIIIGGIFGSYNGMIRNFIARLNVDGSLDNDFDPGSGANDQIYSTSILKDGKIVLGGRFTTINGIASNRIARLNSNGTIDTEYNQGTGANGTISSIAMQEDGKIVIGGDFTFYNGISINRIARLNIDGTLDAAFNPGKGVDGWIASIAIQSDGKIIVGGNFTSIDGKARNPVVRLNADGTLDSTFNPDFGGGSISAIAIQSDGKIIIGGYFTLFNGIIRNPIARLNADGTLDTNFNMGVGANGPVSTIAIQSDGKIIFGGNFTTFNETAINRIARLNTDGTLDFSFNSGIGANYAILSTVNQSDGKIIIGGSFSSYNGSSRNCIARLNADGTLDASFNPGIGANYAISSTVIQSDGKIIIGGYFTTYRGSTRNRIARLFANGNHDATFNPGTGANGAISTIALQDDGKIIVGGDFTSYNGTGRNRVARILNDKNTNVVLIPSSEISIYPNPVSNVLIIEMAGNNEKVYFEIINASGQIVFIGDFIEKTSVQTSNFLPGIYIIKLRKGNTFEVKKIIKE